MKTENAKDLKKPTKEQYGWHAGFDDEPSGWMFEGGEEAYYDALKQWDPKSFNYG